MSSNQKSIINVVVSGDVTMDWNFARGDKALNQHSDWTPEYCTYASWQRGGAALLADLVIALGQVLAETGQPLHIVYQNQAPDQAISPGDPNYNHSFATWALYKSRGQNRWRVAELLGLNRCIQENGDDAQLWQKIRDEPERVDLLVLDDAGLGFRDQAEIWPACLRDQTKRPWIILKMSQPVASGPLWEHLIRNYPDRLFVVTTVNDLRRTEVQISQGLSWERTAQDVIWELDHSQQINRLSRCAGVIVSFNAAGAVVSMNSPALTGFAEEGKAERKLVFDPKVMEGEWEAQHPGGMIGYTTCLLGGIIHEHLLAMDQPRILEGVQRGLAALRNLHEDGYEDAGKSGRPRILFPLRRITEQLVSQSNQFSVTEIQDPVSFLSEDPDVRRKAPASGYWTILEDHYQHNLDAICEQIVSEGAENTLRDVPQGIFGNLFTVDRQEIESFRSIRTLVGEYLAQDKPKRPLSIAVFGPPGSGKSFGIIQIANSLAPGRIQVLEFNLSQYDSAEKLIEALHQVRDANLSGTMPLVFWDEFDTPLANRPLGWLRFFLAPMQDGAFREGQIVHPIGPAVFVFAGGTSARMAEFGQGLIEQESRAAKVPDFISRLKGFVNVLGPNQQTSPGEISNTSDPYYVIRRAIILRSILWRNARHLFESVNGKQKLNIDRGVLRALLKTRFYKHGVRSMESIVAMSQLAGKSRFERSSLPAETQLDLHVDGQEFLALVQQIELTEELLDHLAAHFHANFRAVMEKQGYRYGKETDERAKMHSSLVEFEQLPEDEKDQNRDTVRDIHRKLSASGYIMIPARSNEPPFKFPGTFLDELAIMEHERWMNMKLAAGWQAGPVTEKNKKLHADLVPWEKLSEPARDKDREMVLAIPGILAKAGYTVVKLRPTKAEG